MLKHSVIAATILCASTNWCGAKDVPVVLNDEERNAIEKLCEMAKYANRMGAEQLCAYFANKFAAAERAEEIKNTPPKGDGK